MITEVDELPKERKIKIADGLREATKLLSKNNGWCKGQYARDKNGAPANPISKKATSFCAIGSIYKAFDHDVYEAPYADSDAAFAEKAVSELVREKYQGEGIPMFNDNYAKSAQEVIDVINEAEKRLRGQEDG